jgi:hypothetical protein
VIPNQPEELAMSQTHAVALLSPTTASKYAPPPLATPRPDESNVAAAIGAGSGGIYDDAAKRKWQQYDGVIGCLSQGERDAAFVTGHQRGGR